MSYAHGGGEREFRPVSIAVLTVSDSRDERTDKSGRLLVERLTAAGHRLAACPTPTPTSSGIHIHHHPNVG